MTCTCCQKPAPAAVKLGANPFCLACAHAMLDRAAVRQQARRYEAETKLAKMNSIRGFKVRTSAPDPDRLRWALSPM